MLLVNNLSNYIYIFFYLFKLTLIIKIYFKFVIIINFIKKTIIIFLIKI